MKNEISPESYGKFLTEKMEELCISQQELAEAIGKGQKTVSRYISGENKKTPNADIRWKIECYLEKRSVYKGFRHIPSSRFGELLEFLLNEYNVTQSQLADEIGSKQKYISQYIYGTLKTSVEEQHEILDFFYKKAQLEYGIHQNLRDIAKYLGRLLLDPEEDNHDKMWLLYGDDYENYELDDQCFRVILSLAKEVQNTIYNNPKAFFEQSREQLESDEFGSLTILSCMKRYNQMERFRKMTEKEKQEFFTKLEKNSYLSYPVDDQSTLLFETVTAMRQVISDKSFFIAKEKGLMDFEPIEKKDEIKVRKEDEKAMERCDEMIGSIGIILGSIQELEYKLTFNRFEWYVWMLLLINEYNNTL